ncbi:AAA family ATPase [Candidatus Tisiphia endosymbiont of Micropterix aruncella]|uniref:AAA family ATPase n=1 Tax=Candidatus Tisiphia endosymbiont of Micropterix aruncella TaxID=3066271 RepID=UPI003AA7E896
MIVELSNTNTHLKGANTVKESNKLPKMLVGTDEFYDLVVNSDVFVDKSLMIKELLEDSGKVILITRPRRWGKSLNMDMIRRFLEIEVDEIGKPLAQEKRVNHKLFTGGIVDLGFDETKELQPLKISIHKNIIKRQGQFPVIYINFKEVKGSNYKEIVSSIIDQIIELYERFNYLEQYTQEGSKFLSIPQKVKLKNYLSGDINISYLKNSLKFLSQILYKHFKQKVYILIDEYDTPINNAYLEFGHKTKEFEQILKLFRGIFGSSLKTNPYLEKGVITGILRVAKANLFSDLNNVTEYTLLDDDFSKFYGFTQAEVDDLLTKVPLDTNTEQIKDWYNGYTFGGEVIYNPWSIMQCLAHKGKLDHYWLDSGGTGLIDKVLLSDEMQEDLQSLAAGKIIISPITKQISFADINKPVGLLSLLLFSGYLNPTVQNSEENIYELSAPNREVRHIYKARMLQWVTDQFKIDSSRYYSFVSLLPAGKIEEFKERLQELLVNSTSFHQTGEKKAELFYSGFMLGLINMLSPSYIIASEQESGSGRADIIMIPKAGKGDKAIIIEYKIAKNAEDLVSVAKIGLNQIIDKQYDVKIRQYQYVKQILKISMAFCGKNMELQYQVTEL